MPNEEERLIAEVTGILSNKEWLDRDAIKSILEDFAGLSRDADGVDVILDKLRDCDAEHLDKIMQLKKETNIDIITLLRDYSGGVGSH